MNEPPVRQDFAHFCQVFQIWFATKGWSQARLEAAGGPSKPIQKALLAGDWTSTRPLTVTEKIDRGFAWPPGTAWRVLTTGYDPIADPPGVSLVKYPPPQPEATESDEDDSLLYRRPDGLSDAEWERLKKDTREYLEWQIERAARER
ncbi:MAG: hypothetical protein HOV78_11495 [Hamadaea sp.]|nr:hypothetical protein [Hamadaea sp.]